MNIAYKLTNLVFQYAEEVILNIDELQIEDQKITSLLGENGAGKSTFLGILGLTLTQHSGELEFYSEKVTGNNRQNFRRNIAVVQQKPYLFNLSVMKNIELGLKIRGVSKPERQKRASAVLSEMNLDFMRDRRAHELSGGEIQKVAIARALVLEPKILLLDEPFTHLDSQSGSELEKLIKDLNTHSGQTIIFSTHNQYQAQIMSDNVINLVDTRAFTELALNSFTGSVDESSSSFNTGNVEIHIPSSYKTGSRISIDANHLVISRHRLDSSMRNQFEGKVKSLREESGDIHITVASTELWHVIISQNALNELGIGVGESVWLSFKSSAVKVF